MDAITTQDNPKELIKEKLLLLADKVTEADKMKAALEAFTSVFTVGRYLKGEVAKVPLAEKIHQSLEKSISKRKAVA